MTAIRKAQGPVGFAAAWLRHRGIDWAAELLPQEVPDRDRQDTP
jgi:hypothetical protein